MEEEMKIGTLLQNKCDVIDPQGIIAMVVDVLPYGFYVLQHITGDPVQYRSHRRQVRRFWEVIA